MPKSSRTIKRTGQPVLIVIADHRGEHDLSQAVVAAALPDGTIRVTAATDEGMNIVLQSDAVGVVVDSRVPVDDAVPFCRRIKDNSVTWHLPIMLLTTNAPAPEQRRAALAAGVTEIVSRASDTNRLVSAIREMLEASTWWRQSENTSGECWRQALLQALATTTDSILLVEPLTRRILMSSVSMRELLGYTAAELSGRSVELLHLSPQSCAAWVERFATAGSGTSAQATCQLRHRNGYPVDTVQTISHIKNPADSGITLLCTLRPLPGSMIQQSPAGRPPHIPAMDKIGRGFAHEINQPINAMQVTLTGLSYWLAKDRMPDQATLTTKIARTLRQLSRIEDLVQQFRSLLVDDGSGEAIAGDLNATVQHSVGFLSKQLAAQKVTVRLRMDESVPQAQFDPVQLEHIILHLLACALHAPPGTEASPNIVDIHTYWRNPHVHLRIEVSGPRACSAAAETDNAPAPVSLASPQLSLDLPIFAVRVSAWGGTYSTQTLDSGNVLLTIKLSPAMTTGKSTQAALPKSSSARQ